MHGTGGGGSDYSACAAFGRLRAPLPSSRSLESFQVESLADVLQDLVQARNGYYVIKALKKLQAESNDQLVMAFNFMREHLDEGMVKKYTANGPSKIGILPAPLRLLCSVLKEVDLDMLCFIITQYPIQTSELN